MGQACRMAWHCKCCLLGKCAKNEEPKKRKMHIGPLTDRKLLTCSWDGSSLQGITSCQLLLSRSRSYWLGQSLSSTVVEVAMVDIEVLRVLWMQPFPFRKWLLVTVNVVSCTSAYALSVVDIGSVNKKRGRATLIEIKTLETNFHRFYRSILFCNCLSSLFCVE